MPLALGYRNNTLPKTVELDILAFGELPVTILSSLQVSSLHIARFRARPRNGNWPFGLILNFHETRLVNGIRRVVNPDFRKT